MAEFYSASLDRLLNVMLELKQKDELYAFLSELCSAKELRDLSVRLEVCLLLQEGLNYRDISERVGISPATISRVYRSFSQGTGGVMRARELIEEKGL